MIVTHCALCLSCEGRFRDELQTAYDAALKSAIPQIDNLIEKSMCVLPFPFVGACATPFGRTGRRVLVIVHRWREPFRALLRESCSVAVVWPLLPGLVTIYIRHLVVSVDALFAPSCSFVCCPFRYRCLA